MIQTIILFATILIVFFGYVAFIWKRYGILPSISESWYRLPDKDKILFTLFCWGFAFPAIILGDNVLMFLAGTGISFVGAAAQFKQTMTRTVHIIGAFTGVLFSQLAIYFDYNLFYINLIFISLALSIFLLRKTKIKNYIWWIEITAFTSIIVALAIVLF